MIIDVLMDALARARSRPRALPDIAKEPTASLAKATVGSEHHGG